MVHDFTVDELRLNRYDGYNFKVFGNDPFNAFSLAENTVTAVFEDSRGWLWVGTDSKGVDLYDRQSGSFHHIVLNFKPAGNTSAFDVISICEAVDGSICLLQVGNGLIRIAIPPDWPDQLPAIAELSHLTTVTLFPTARFQCPGDKEPEILRAMELRDNGDLWVYSRIRPYLLEPDQQRVTPILENAVPGTEANSAAGNRQNSDFWVAQTSALIRFRNGLATVFDFPKHPTPPWIMAKPGPDQAFWIAVDNHVWLLTPDETPDFSKPDWVLDAKLPP